MDKPQATVSTNRQLSDNTYGNSSPRLTREFRSLSPRSAQEEGNKFSWLAGGAGKGRIFLPALLAVITGVLLGMCLLVVFKGQSDTSALAAPSTPGGQTTAATSGTGKNATTGIAGQAFLPGVTLYAWQVGSFADRAPAEKQQNEHAQKGVQATIRGTGPFQLFAGVAADKNAGASIASELQKRQVSFYAKEFKIEARQGTIKGLPDTEAGQIAQALSAELKLAESMLPLAVTEKRDGEKAALLGKQVAGVDLKKQAALLEKVGLKEQSAELTAMHQKLTEAAQALQTPSILTVQSKLTAFYATYESLVRKLITVQ